MKSKNFHNTNGQNVKTGIQSFLHHFPFLFFLSPFIQSSPVGGWVRAKVRFLSLRPEELKGVAVTPCRPPRRFATRFREISWIETQNMSERGAEANTRDWQVKNRENALRNGSFISLNQRTLIFFCTVQLLGVQDLRSTV